jgi:hypothetical protein
MNVYGYFTIGKPSAYPEPAVSYPSLAAARRAFEELADSIPYGSTNPRGYLYLGKAEGDEETLGYPDYPDYRLKVGRFGGLVCRRLHA